MTKYITGDKKQVARIIKENLICLKTLNKLT